MAQLLTTFSTLLATPWPRAEGQTCPLLQERARIERDNRKVRDALKHAIVGSCLRALERQVLRKLLFTGTSGQSEKSETRTPGQSSYAPAAHATDIEQIRMGRQAARWLRASGTASKSSWCVTCCRPRFELRLADLA